MLKMLIGQKRERKVCFIKVPLLFSEGAYPRKKPGPHFNNHITITLHIGPPDYFYKTKRNTTLTFILKTLQIFSYQYRDVSRDGHYHGADERNQFSSHVIGLQSPMAQLSPSCSDHTNYKQMLQSALDWRTKAADNLRQIACLQP